MKSQLKSRIATAVSASLLSLAMATPALATPPGHAYGHYKDKGYSNHREDFARVTHVEPIYETIAHRIPEQSCYIETRYVPVEQSRSHTPMILGAIIGGALGNELGHNSSNKKVGAAVGGILGGSIGRDIGNSRNRDSGHTRVVEEEVCETQYRTEHEQRIVGYNVDYRYQGHDYRTQTDYDPGKRIKVAVNVRPMR
ncbi:glycine zipper 2TM domain-containing protein [Pseudomaricurvus sp. HS19]|uniref:glycine zipper 2TM domain-containing protein n=1 Tax=Pseudomaricurvus sp. HS19 TaxID=2692626 RepID=UPI00136CC710|nr:glycine zipper 2TM domain-containing protein [Pseudomaricurvus sp. HS19]MYM64766.1 glycine zipper 2TM domain-containing protein [Pseudomaricurvus sp. HS19]